MQNLSFVPCGHEISTILGKTISFKPTNAQGPPELMLNTIPSFVYEMFTIITKGVSFRFLHITSPWRRIELGIRPDYNTEIQLFVYHHPTPLSANTTTPPNQT